MAQATLAPQAKQSLPGPGYKWAVVGMLWFICFFNYADRQAIYSIFPVLERDYGFNKEQLGRIGSIFGLVYALTAPFAGQVPDRFPRKIVILSGLYVWSAITGLTAACSKLWQFVTVRAAEGLGETFYFPASMSLISDYHSPRSRSRAMGLHQTSVYAGSIAGGILAGVLAEAFNWQLPFILFGGLGIVLGIALAAFIREPRRNEAQLLEEAALRLDRSDVPLPDGQQEVVQPVPMPRFLLELLRTPSALLLMTAFFGANMVAFVFLTWLPTFLYEEFHLSLTQAALRATLCIQVPSMLGSILGGLIADFSKRRLAGGRMTTQAIGTLVIIPFILIFGRTSEMLLLLCVMGMMGLCKGIYDSNIVAALYDVIPDSRRATAMGVMNMVGWLGGALGPWLLGLIVHNKWMTMRETFASTALVYLAASFLLLLAGLVFARRDIARVQAIA